MTMPDAGICAAVEHVVTWPEVAHDAVFCLMWAVLGLGFFWSMRQW